MPDRVGQRLDNYHLIRLLGAGNFGKVYLAEHIYRKQITAMKVLPRLAEGGFAGFLNEARAMRLKHANIVQVQDFGVDNHIPFIVMDYASHGTLGQRHPRGTHIPLHVVLLYVRQIAEALQYAHDERVIHRDIKPENLLLGSNNEVLVSDFGIATIAHSSRSQDIQEMAGTLAYMAPEQIQGKPRFASDQYALGILVYEWLSGERPFHGTPIEVATQHMLVTPPPLHEKMPQISSDIGYVVMTALSKDPKDRFRSVRAFAVAFEQACMGQIQSVCPTVPDPDASLLLPSVVTSAAFAASQAAESEKSGQDSDYDDEGDRLAPPPPARTASPAGDTEAAEPIIQLLVRPSKTTLKLSPEATETQTPSRPLTKQRAGSTGMIAGTGTAAAASRASGTAAPQQRMVNVGGSRTGSGGARGGSSGGTRRSKILWLAGLALLVLTVGVICTTLAYAQPAMFGSVARGLPGQVVAANVMITPDSQVITDSYVITGVSGDPNAAQQQVSAHPVTGFVQSQPQAVNATGRSQKPGIAAQGKLTFYNSATFSQSIQAKIVFMTDNGIKVQNDTLAIIPEGSAATPSSVTVSATALQVGNAGNIAAGAINQPCCVSGVAVQNTQAFTGGQDPKDYRFVRQSDVDSVVNPLERQLLEQAINALQKQVAAGEQLVTGEQWGPKCTTKASTDAVADDHGVNVTSITVSVAATCTGHAYNKQQVLKLMQEKLQAKIERARGRGYQLVGNVNPKISIQSVRDGTITMVVDSQGVWAFQLNDTLKQKMAQQIAGKTVAEATRILSAQKGISNVKIDGGGDTLPSDVTQIVFAVQTIPGLSANETPGGATTPGAAG
jgi:serine/threonine protein kinase